MESILRVRKVSVLSVALFSAFVMAVFGFVMAIALEIFGYAMENVAAASMPGEPVGMISLIGTFGVLAFIAITVFYAAVGFISGAFCAWLFNIFAKMTGGIKVEFADVEAKK